MKTINPQDIPILGQPQPMPTVRLMADNVPTWRVKQALNRGVLNRVMMLARGGLGDIVCTEPTVRFALKQYKDVKLSMVTGFPTIFKHLSLEKLFDDNDKEIKIFKPDYFWVTNYPAEGSIDWDFFSHPYMNTVDAISITAFRHMLHTEEKDIQLESNETFEKINDEERSELLEFANSRKLVLIHAGVTWKSRTFPVTWWNNVIEECKAQNIKPVLIGAKTREGVGFIDVRTDGCLDLRGRTSIDDLIWLCQYATVVLTNDSSPMHFAASSNPKRYLSGRAWIGYVPTCRHPDFITHWRRNPTTLKNEWQWREVNLGIEAGGFWNHADYYLKEKPVSLMDYEYKLVLQCLPEPKTLADFAASKVGSP